jgi:hypothetical protein
MRTRRVDLERQIKEKTMGRPLNKRYFGTIANADGGTMPNGDAAFNVTVAADVGNGIVEQSYILNQRSETKFTCSDGASSLSCTLVNKTAANLAVGEMRILGYVNASGDGVAIRKLQNRTCFDFANNRYTWELQDDSTETLLVLTAI